MSTRKSLYAARRNAQFDGVPGVSTLAAPVILSVSSPTPGSWLMVTGRGLLDTFRVQLATVDCEYTFDQLTRALMVRIAPGTVPGLYALTVYTIAGTVSEPVTVVEVSSSWTPLSDLATLGLLLMPGNYDANGLGGGVGRWADSSAFGRHADAASAGVTPIDAGGGVPTFNGITHFLTSSVSLADDVSYPGNHIGTVDNGSIIVIAKQTAALQTMNPGVPYGLRGPISGTGATPQLTFADDGAYCDGYDATDYTLAKASSGIAAINVPHILAGAWDATGVYAACDENTFSGFTVYYPGRVALSTGNIGSETWIGRTFSEYFEGTIYAVGVYPTRDDGLVAMPKWRAWAIAQGLV